MIEAISTKNYNIYFPKLMIFSDELGDTIVLMLNKYGKGNGIATSNKIWEKNLMAFYETSNGWDIENFKDYNESLTLKNKQS